MLGNGSSREFRLFRRNPNELQHPNLQIFRQVHPPLILNSEITSQVFWPIPEDQGCLSAYDGNLIKAERSWNYCTNHLKRQSVGVVTLTVQKCNQEELRITPISSDFSEYVLINFSGNTGNQVNRFPKNLREILTQMV